MLSYNQIVSKINEFATSHRQINTFGDGDIWEQGASDDIVYPCLWLTPIAGSIDAGQKSMSVNFKAIFSDIVQDDRSNERDVLSDELQKCADLTSYLQQWAEIEIGDSAFTTEPFIESLSDKVAGWILTLNIVVPYTSDYCIIPIK